MSDNDATFNPAQIDREIDMLARCQAPWPDASSSDTDLISELSHVYAQDEAIAESAWRRLMLEMEATRPLKIVAHAIHQGRVPGQMLSERQESPQATIVPTPGKRPARRIRQRLTTYVALLAIIVLVASVTLVIRRSRQMQTPLNVPQTQTLLNDCQAQTLLKAFQTTQMPSNAAQAQTPSGTAPGTQVGSIYMSSQSGIYREDLASKKLLWHYAASQQLQDYSSVFVVGNVAAFTIESSGMVGLNTTTGTPLWAEKDRCDTLLAAGNGLMIGIARRFLSNPTNPGEVYLTDLGISEITAYQAINGQPQWSHSFPLPTSVSDRYQAPSFNAVLANGVFYLLNGPQMFAFSVSSGALLWHTSMPAGFDGSFAITNPVVSGNALYFLTSKLVAGDSQAWLFAISTDTGKEIWHAISGNGHVFGQSSLTVNNGIVYIVGALPSASGVDCLYAYDARNGRFIRRYPTDPQGSITAPLLSMQNLIIYLLWDGPSKGKMVAFDTRTEKTAWSIEGGAFDQQIVNDVIYAPIGSQIIAYSAAGKILGEYNAHRTPSKTSSIPAANFTVVNE